MKIIGVYNIKGGVGKTATSVNIGHLAASSGLRTLIWDLDPQAAQPRAGEFDLGPIRLADVLDDGEPEARAPGALVETQTPLPE